MPDVLRIRIAVALWQDPKTGEWSSFAEGWEKTQKGGDPKESAEATILGDELNSDAPLYWRYIEADVPVPTDTELVVEGSLVD